MLLCNSLISFKALDEYYSVQTDSVEIRIIFLTDSIIRIRAGFDGDFSEESYSLMMTAWEDRLDDMFKDDRKRINFIKAKVDETNKQITLTGKELNVIIDKEPFRICVYDKEGTCLHADIVDLGYMSDQNQRRIHTSQIEKEDCFYGFGEKTGDFNKARKTMSMCPKDTMGYDPKDTDSLYKHIPFYIKLIHETKKSIGYFYHTTYECDFDMGREHSNYWKRHSRFRVDGGDIDLFLIAGPSIQDIIERYTDLTGKSAMLPRYALGYLGSSMYYPELDRDCDDAIVEFIDTAKMEDIPIDGFQLSSGYCVHEGKRCVFTWNRERFKNPRNFFEEMKVRGVSVSPNVKPGLLLEHPLLPELKKEGIFVKDSKTEKEAIGTWWGGKGIFVDFTNKKARTVWKDYLKKYVLEYGTSSVWNDNCEYDSLVDKDFTCDFEGKGGTIGQLKSVMANIMCKITEEAIRETHENVRPFVVCRSGHSGIQKYAQTWAGDNYTSWDSLKYNIGTILGMGLSGVANHGCDVGGFYGPSPDKELFVRWIQNGIFQPRFSIHSTNTDNTVTEPWMFGDCTSYIKDAIHFRYRLIPYLYSLMERAYERGLPIIQPMVSAFQQDDNCYEEGIDFMLGDSLLIANVVEKGAEYRSIYLPKDEVFYDYYTRDMYEGGQTITVPVTIDSIPIMIRGGGIVPIALNQMDNLHTQQTTGIHLILAPDKDATFTLYEDDGISLDYQKGIYLKTRISMKAGECVVVDFSKHGSYKTEVTNMHLDVINKDKGPYWVKVDGQLVKHYLNRKKFEEAECGWYYSQRLKSVLIHYPNPEGNYKVEISFEQFDMLGM